MASSSSTSPDQTRSSSDLLQNARFDARTSTGSSSNDFITAPTSSQLLGDAAALHPLAGLNTSDLDYLSLDDGKLNELEGGQTVLPSRGWGDELCYGTGTTYLVGLGTGGLWGLREGWSRSKRISTAGTAAASSSPSAAASASASASANATVNSTLKQASSAATAAAAEALKTPSPAAATSKAGAVAGAATAGTTQQPASAAEKATATARQAFKSPSFRVRLNTILNSVTRRGSFVGNNAGVLALIYNAFNSSIDKYRGRHDIYGSMLAGASTGLIWKSTAGVRPMFIASAGMTAGAAAWTIVKPSLL